MIRPGVTFVLWLAIASFIVVNDVVGDTWIAGDFSADRAACLAELERLVDAEAP